MLAMYLANPKHRIPGSSPLPQFFWNIHEGIENFACFKHGEDRQEPRNEGNLYVQCTEISTGEIWGPAPVLFHY